MLTPAEFRLVNALDKVGRGVSEEAILLRHAGQIESAKRLDALAEFCQIEARIGRAQQ